MSNESNLLENQVQETKFLTFKEILFKYISHLPLFFFSIGIALLVAWSYLRWATPLYKVSSSMVIKQENASSIKTGEKYSSIFEPVNKVNMQDEMELIKSKEFLIQTVHNLSLNNHYIEHGNIRSSEVV